MIRATKGARPAQAELTRDNDLTKTDESRGVIEAMVDALKDHVIEGQEACWHPDVRWIGSAGCGVKPNLRALVVHTQLSRIWPSSTFQKSM